MKKLLSLLVLFTMLYTGLDAQPSQDYSTVAELAESDFTFEMNARQAASAQNKPWSVFLPGQMFAEAKALENGQPVYTVVTNFANPANGGATMFYNDINNNYDLSKAKINYGNGNVIDNTEKKGSSSTNKTTPAPTGRILLIPESTNDAVMAFDAVTGDLIDASYILPDATNFSTPICAQPDLSYMGDIYTTDQLDDLVQLHTGGGGGTFINTFAPAGGVNTAILDNIRGADFHPTTGNLLVTVSAGANADAVAEFDAGGNYLGNFVANGSGGIDGPWDAMHYEAKGTYLVSASTSDAIHEYDLTGAYLGDLVSGPAFPEQINEKLNGDFLYAQFSGATSGVYIHNSTGTQLSFFNAVTGNRGVYELGNGNILTTNGGGVFELDGTTGALLDTKISGVSARFIHEYSEQPSIPTVSEWGLILLALLLLSVAGVVLGRVRAYQFAGYNGTVTSGIPFNRSLYISSFIGALVVALLIGGFSFWLYGTITTIDLIGSMIALPIAAYLIHLIGGYKQ